jgi:hypothetical protein
MPRPPRSESCQSNGKPPSAPPPRSITEAAIAGKQPYKSRASGLFGRAGPESLRCRSVRPVRRSRRPHARHSRKRNWSPPWRPTNSSITSSKSSTNSARGEARRPLSTQHLKRAPRPTPRYARAPYPQTPTVAASRVLHPTPSLTRCRQTQDPSDGNRKFYRHKSPLRINNSSDTKKHRDRTHM